MKPIHSFHLAAVLGIASVSIATAATIIDNFSDGSLSEYTQTRVLDNGIAETNISFSTTGGALRASYATGTLLNQAEQVVLLRDDYSLAIGEMLTVDVSMVGVGSQYDFGIIVANTKTPTSATVGNPDTRKTMQFAASMIRPSDNSVRSFYYDGTGPAALSTTDAILGSVDESTVAKLWIKRNTASSISMGYTNNLGVDFTSRTVTSFGSGVGTAVGFFTDLRTNSATLGALDNLTIVPEPSSAALAGLAALGLAFRRRR